MRDYFVVTTYTKRVGLNYVHTDYYTLIKNVDLDYIYRYVGKLVLAGATAPYKVSYTFADTYYFNKLKARGEIISNEQGFYISEY